MLFEKKISMTAKVFVGDAEIANLGAIMDVESGDISFFTRQLDKPLCKKYREQLRTDVASFEDFAYSVQETVQTLNK